MLRGACAFVGRRLCGLDRWGRLAVLHWTGALLLVAARVLASEGHSVYRLFVGAARNWLAGDGLYLSHADPYRYSPLVAVLFVPFALLPDAAGGVVWRLLNAGVYLAALAWWAHAVLPRSERGVPWALLWLLVLPLSVGNLNNGQSNPLVLGLVLASVALLAPATGAPREGWRWALAGGCLALACLFKLYPIAFALLLATTVPRRFLLWLLLGLALGLALPFALQRPGYVAEQYAGWLDHLRSDDRHLQAREFWYRDLRLLASVCGVQPSSAALAVVQVGAGVGMAGVCLLGRAAGWDRRRLLTLLTALGCGWMTVFGPATESATYLFLAPTAAWALLDAWQCGRPVWVRGVLVLGYLLLAAGPVAAWFPGGRSFHALGEQPLAGLLLLGGVLAAEVHEALATSSRRQARPEIATQ